MLKQGQVHSRLVDDDVLHPPARSRLSISSTSRFKTGKLSFMDVSMPAPGEAESTIDRRRFGIEARGLLRILPVPEPVNPAYFTAGFFGIVISSVVTFPNVSSGLGKSAALPTTRIARSSACTYFLATRTTSSLVTFSTLVR